MSTCGKSSTAIMLVWGLSAATAYGKSNRIELLWTARGLKGAEQVQELNKKSSEGPLEKGDQCEWLLASAFMAHSNINLRHMTTARDGNTTIFKLALPSQSGGSFSQLEFFYSRNDESPEKIQLTKLAEGWNHPISGDNDAFQLTGDDCMITFDRRDPLLAKAKSTAKRKRGRRSSTRRRRPRR